MSEMNQILSLVFQVTLIHALHLCCCEGTSITLSPLGMVSVCPGGQALLTCEIMSGSGFLYWTVSVPHLDTLERIVADAGDFSPTLRFDGLHSTAFTITRTSINPLISQMMVNDVTTAMNGSTIYCSEDDNENGAPMVTINVINEDSFLNHLNVSLVNHFLRNGITVTLQWLQKPGTVYGVNVLPDTEVTNVMNDNSIMVNLTISYNIQYKLNLSISSSLCDVTTTRVLKYVNCDLPAQLLHRSDTLATGSQEYPLEEGQIITYTCQPGFVMNGPNASVCTENGEWEPDPGEAYCTAECGVPPVDRNVTLNYNSTLEGAVLTLTCENDTTVDEQILHLTCSSNGNWMPDPAQFTCSELSTVPPGTDLIHSSPHTSEESSNLGVILGSVLGVTIIGATAIIIAVSAISYLIKKAEKKPCNKEGSQLPQTLGPLYEEIQVKSTTEQEHLVELKENVAYGQIAK